MKKFLLAAVAAGSVFAAAPAQATTIFNPADGVITLIGGTATFTVSSDEAGDFEHVFTFDTVFGREANAVVTTILLNGIADFDFSSITLDGNAFTKTRKDSDVVEGTTGAEDWVLSDILISGGTHTIRLSGTLSGVIPDERFGSYTGSLNIAPVPEPATWALMIGGFGLVGLGARRSRRTKMVTA